MNGSRITRGRNLRDEPRSPKQAGEAHEGPPDVEGHLGRIGSGDEIGRPDQIEELAGSEPASLPHDLPLHQRQVSGRSTEPQTAELEEDAEQRTQVRLPDNLAQKEMVLVGQKVPTCLDLVRFGSGHCVPAGQK